MQFDAGLTGEAAALAREHKDLLGRLPATVHAFILVELQKWLTIFGPERRYQRSLLEHLSRFSRSELSQAVAGISRVEIEAGANRMARGDPARFQEEAQSLLRKRRLLPAWRKEVDSFFQRIDPAIEAELYPETAPRRLVVQLYASGIAVQPDKLWGRFKDIGVRVRLNLEGAQGSEAFLRALFGGRDDGAPALFAGSRELAGVGPLETWIIESHEALHQLCENGAGRRFELRPTPLAIGAAPAGPLTGLSYDRLRGYRDDLMRALYSKIQSGVESPQMFAAYARSLKIAPGPDALLQSDDVLRAFVRDVLLTGNGTLFVNNTFVEWAAVQALRRAQPRILVTRFGVRDKLKPFSSLLLFSQPRPSDQIPLLEDPVGSFIDVEQLSYYIWLNAEKSPAYRRKTLYLFLAEGIDEMLAIRSDLPVAMAGRSAVTLSDVYATMLQWLGAPAQEPPGRAILPLIS
jgi:hypothetical protein